MERQVIYRDRQELQAADLNNSQTFTDEALQHLIKDAITAERQLVGLALSAASATELQVSPGRLWVGDVGKVYRLDQALALSLFGHLPLTDSRYLAVGVTGQEVETDAQPRDYLIDLQTGQTEPRVVTMERLRQVVVFLTPGQESPEPQKPVPPTGQTLLGYVLLNTAGIVSVEQNVAATMVRLFTALQRLGLVEHWQAFAQPKIATLASDLSLLAQTIAQFGRDRITQRLNELAADMARVKEKETLPTAYASYDIDRFVDTSDSETGHVEYAARIEEGLSFPWAGETYGQLALLNPFNTDVHPALRDQGYLIPAYAEAKRLELGPATGELSISQYQYQTFTLKTGSAPVTLIQYGPTRWIPAKHLANGRWKRYWEKTWGTPPPELGYDLLQTKGKQVLIRYTWTWHLDVPYQYLDTVTTQISGSQIAQTYLNSQHGWLTKVGLPFTARDTNGAVYLSVCETRRGVPDLDRVLATASVTAANLLASPAATVFAFARPLFLEAGKRYAFVLTTAGNHKVGTVAGTAYTQGAIYYSMDGEYHQGDYTKDLAMTLWFASFANPRVTVEMEPASLSGGIADLALQAKITAPDTTQLLVEYQFQGQWYPVDADTGPTLLGLPAMLPIRLTFIGSTDLMPSIDLVGSTLWARRPATSFLHRALARTLAAPTSQVQVQVLLRDFDAGHHTLAPKLIVGGNELTATSTSDATEEEGVRRTAVFDIAPAASSYQVKLIGTTDSALVPFHLAERIDIAI